MNLIEKYVERMLNHTYGWCPHCMEERNPFQVTFEYRCSVCMTKVVVFQGYFGPLYNMGM